MERDKRIRRVLFVLVLCYVSGFVLMVTSICTPSWYTTHPLAPLEQTSYGSLGLIKHCSTTKGVCVGREGILKFSDHYWPYRPLRNQDFDTTLLTLIFALVCTMAALGLTILLRMDSFNQRPCLKGILLLVSTKSGISGVLYLDIQVSSEQFQYSWSSYMAWLSVGLSIFANIPVVYLIWLKPSTTGDVKSDEFAGGNTKENEYIFTSDKQQLSLLSQKHFQYADIHDVE